MGDGKGHSIKNTVTFTPRCNKAYKKLVKRCDPQLRKIIEDNISQLRVNSELGEELRQNLKGRRSIHIDQFKFRIVYEIKKDGRETTIVIQAIGHRKGVYDDLAAYYDL